MAHTLPKTTFVAIDEIELRLRMRKIYYHSFDYLFQILILVCIFGYIFLWLIIKCQQWIGHATYDLQIKKEIAVSSFLMLNIHVCFQTYADCNIFIINHPSFLK
jgi:hypothetical protein